MMSSVPHLTKENLIKHIDFEVRDMTNEFTGIKEQQISMSLIVGEDNKSVTAAMRIIPGAGKITDEERDFYFQKLKEGLVDVYLYQFMADRDVAMALIRSVQSKYLDKPDETEVKEEE